MLTLQSALQAAWNAILAVARKTIHWYRFGRQRLFYLVRHALFQSLHHWLDRCEYQSAILQASLPECETALTHSGNAWRIWRGQIHISVYAERGAETGCNLQYQLKPAGLAGALALTLYAPRLREKVLQHARQVQWLCFMNQANPVFRLHGFDPGQPDWYHQRYITLTDPDRYPGHKAWSAHAIWPTFIRNIQGASRPTSKRLRRLLLIEFAIPQETLSAWPLAPWHAHSTDGEHVILELLIGLDGGAIQADGRAAFGPGQERNYYLELTLPVKAMPGSELLQARYLLWRAQLPVLPSPLQRLSRLGPPGSWRKRIGCWTAGWSRIPASLNLRYEHNQIELETGTAGRELIGRMTLQTRGGLARGVTLPESLYSSSRLCYLQTPDFQVQLQSRSQCVPLNRIYRLDFTNDSVFPLQAFLAHIFQQNLTATVERAFLASAVDWQLADWQTLDLKDFQYRQQPAHNGLPECDV
ncbi:MAG: hypothetical protein KDK39_13610 [Leptospiraceae bacterium]|nr:hypothetical protein [Leptospiraceae bacterium]